MCLNICLALLSISLSAYAKVDLPEMGCVDGTFLPGGYKTQNFKAYLGIPYAQPPVGRLRFKNPKPVPAWSGILHATTPKEDCIQKSNGVISGSEDCLYLNVYRPKTCSWKETLPVLFYIHWGGFFCGSVNPEIAGPEYFMDTQEVIVVTAAYRLGPFGFLSTGDENMPGNFGLKDQNMALQWIRANIAAFDGDPNRVTIVGHDAGASSVHFHMLSPASRGLFQQAIMISGNGLTQYTDPIKQPRDQAVKVAEGAGISNASNLSTAQLAEALRDADAIKLLDAGDSLRFWHYFPLMTFRPSIEKESWANAFLTRHPAYLSRRGNFTQVPMMMGFVAQKGEAAPLALSVIGNKTLVAEFNEKFDELFAKMLEVSLLSVDKLNNTVDKLVKEYFQDMHQLNSSTVNGFMEFLSDMGHNYPFYKFLQYYLNHTDVEKSPIYLYKFNYRSPFSFSKIYSGGSVKDYGAVHLDDYLYMFRHVSQTSFGKFDPDSQHAKLIQEYVRMIVEFAKKGKPQNFDKVPTCTKESLKDAGVCHYLEFVNNDSEGFKKVVRNQFDVKRMLLWDKIMADLMILVKNSQPPPTSSSTPSPTLTPISPLNHFRRVFYCKSPLYLQNGFSSCFP